MSKPVLAWHFLNADRRMAHDGQLVEPGYTYIWEPDNGEMLTLCRHGLHASIDPLDALSYAPGPVACRVRMSGEIIHGRDKLVATQREVLAMADVTDELYLFARQCALDVVDLWDAPDVVRRYLTTGNAKLRRKARAAAKAAARYAATTSADAAAWAAASVGAAARYAAKTAARYAAKTAASAPKAQTRRLHDLLVVALNDD